MEAELHRAVDFQSMKEHEAALLASEPYCPVFLLMLLLWRNFEAWTSFFLPCSALESLAF
jgi:hypothetical protein